MNKTRKTLLSMLVLVTLTTMVFANSPSKRNGKKNPPNQDITSTEIKVKNALNVVEAFQTTFRSISETMLPAVVEVDVIEKKVVENPFGGMDFGWPFNEFFGTPKNGDDSRKQEYEHKGLGSGVIVRKTGSTYYVLTNNHVAGSATKISVKLNDSREFDAKLVGTDERMDIALVSFESNDKTIPVATLGDSDSVKPGDICMAFGAPLGYSQSVTQGIVSAVGRSESHMSSISDYIQTDAAINQGNSGGPLVNIYGEVIGINTWIASQSGGSQGLGFAIPINNIKNSIDSFINKGRVVYGWVGVSLLETTEEYKKELGVDGVEGALATEVFTNSPAFKGGIKPGDYIIALNGKKVKNVNQLVRDVGLLKAGTTAKFSVIRGGKRINDLVIEIEERVKDSEIQNSKMWPGFIAAPITEEIRKELELPSKVKGVIVTNIEEKTPAASLRLQNGDIITGVNGVSVDNLAEFYNELAAASKFINFDIYSNGGTITTGTYKF